MDRSKGFFITVICFVYFVICVLVVVYFLFSNFSFFSLDYNTPVSFLGTLLTIPQALFLMSIFILITSLMLFSKIKSMVAFFKKATYLFAIYNISVAFCAALFLFIPCIYSCRRNYKSVVNTGEISLSRVVLLEDFDFGGRETLYFYVLRFPFGLGESIATIKLYSHSVPRKDIEWLLVHENNQYHITTTNSDAIETLTEINSFPIHTNLIRL